MNPATFSDVMNELISSNVLYCRAFSVSMTTPPHFFFFIVDNFPHSFYVAHELAFLTLLHFRYHMYACNNIKL